MANGHGATKRCTACHIDLPLSAFGTHLRPNRTPGKRYVNSRCRQCVNQTWNPSAGRDRALRRRYGITSVQFEAMFGLQDYRCASCGSTVPRGKYWHIDHDHACCPNSTRTCGQCIRAILCHGCNTALGNLGDSPERVKLLLAYAEAHCG